MWNDLRKMQHITVIMTAIVALVAWIAVAVQWYTTDSGILSTMTGVLVGWTLGFILCLVEDGWKAARWNRHNERFAQYMSDFRFNATVWLGFTSLAIYLTTLCF